MPTSPSDEGTLRQEPSGINPPRADEPTRGPGAAVVPTLVSDQVPRSDGTERLADGGAGEALAPQDRTHVQTVLPTVSGPVVAARVPGYEIQSELGRGGMGVVYKARHLQLNRLVALKMILGGEYAHARDLERFRTEAVRLARVQHPNIVQIFDVGEHAGRPYFAMEYVEGGTLHKLIGGKPQPPRVAAALIETLALAVHTAHQRGIVHRDLKPANILLHKADLSIAPTRPDQPGAKDLGFRISDLMPKVSDFGLAKGLDEASETASGAILGTPSYMAPEQASGRVHDVGPAADVWALGAILYELLTGRPPFRGTTAPDTLLLVIHEEPAPPRQWVRDVPRDLETVCLKCLSKDPARRYASAQHLAEDLRRFLDDEPILARPVGLAERAWKWARRRPALAALAVTVLLSGAALAAGGVWFTQRVRAERNVAERRFRMSREAVDRYFTEVSENTLLDEPGLEPLRQRLLGLAREYYEEFVRERGDDPSVRAEMARGLFRLAQITAELGRSAEAIALHEQARGLFGQLLATAPGDATLRHELAETHYHLARLHRRKNELGPAEESARAALSLWQELIREHAGDPRIEAGLARGHFGVANVLVVRRDYEAAREQFQLALERRERLAEARPANETYQRDVAATWDNLAVLHTDRRAWDLAAAARRRALDVIGKLSAAHPSRGRYRHDFARAQFNLGALYMLKGSADEAAPCFRAAAEHWRFLHHVHPEVREYAAALGNALFSQSQAEHVQRQTAQADDSMAQAAELRGKLASDAQATAEDRAAHALCLAEQATRAYRRGELSAAETLGGDAARRREALTREHPDVARFQTELADSLHVLGLVASDSARLEQARERFRRALVLCDDVLRRHPDDFATHVRRLNLLIASGDAENLWGQAALALTLFEQASSALRPLREKHRSAAELSRAALDASRGRATALTKLRRFDEARAEWDRALDSLDENPLSGKPLFRLLRLATVARTADYAQAIQELVELETQWPVARDSAVARWHFARVHAAAAATAAADERLTAAERTGKSEALSAAAVQILARARDLGFFATAARISELDADADFAGLRARADYREFRASLPASAVPPQ